MLTDFDNALIIRLQQTARLEMTRALDTCSSFTEYRAECERVTRKLNAEIIQIESLSTDETRRLRLISILNAQSHQS